MFSWWTVSDYTVLRLLWAHVSEWTFLHVAAYRHRLWSDCAHAEQADLSLRWAHVRNYVVSRCGWELNTEYTWYVFFCQFIQERQLFPVCFTVNHALKFWIRFPSNKNLKQFTLKWEQILSFLVNLFQIEDKNNLAELSPVGMSVSFEWLICRPAIIVYNNK